MKATDLMIGDLVIYGGLYTKVIYIGQKISLYDGKGTEFTIDPCHIEPIPLTEEILVKNGFEKCHNDEAPVEECYFFRLFNKQCGWLDIDAFGLEEELGAEFTYNDVNINYVHQLQHLLRLCGIEKELIID